MDFHWLFNLSLSYVATTAPMFILGSDYSMALSIGFLFVFKLYILVLDSI